MPGVPDHYRLDEAASEEVFRRNVRVMVEQGATLREMVLELSRKDGDYRGEPDPKVEERVAEVVRQIATA